jgi:hypothetical protein
MNVRYLVPSVSRRLLSLGALMLAAGLQQPVHASSVDLSKFRRIEPQFIAALGDPGERLQQAGLRGSHRRWAARHSLSGRTQGATARQVTTSTAERYFHRVAGAPLEQQVSR